MTHLAALPLYLAAPIGVCLILGAAYLLFNLLDLCVRCFD